MKNNESNTNTALAVDFALSQAQTVAAFGFGQLLGQRLIDAMLVKWGSWFDGDVVILGMTARLAGMIEEHGADAVRALHETECIAEATTRAFEIAQNLWDFYGDPFHPTSDTSWLMEYIPASEEDIQEFYGDDAMDY